jgi:hypothetical protein
VQNITKEQHNLFNRLHATLHYILGSDNKKIMRGTFFIIIVLTLTSCRKDANEQFIWVNATVVDTKDINCAMPVLNFNDDSVKVFAFTGNHDLTYVAKGFPSQLNIQGKKVLVQIAILKPEESFPCFTLGPNWPAIKILDAKDR